jgi:hypothetical protein
MLSYIAIFFLLGIVFLGVILFLKIAQKDNRKALINQYQFKQSYFSEIRKIYPHLTSADFQKVSKALKTIFMAHLQHPHDLHAMPSKVADELWHIFILDTRAYQLFCDKAFGHYFHHTPSDNISKQADEVAMTRIWRYACSVQGLQPSSVAGGLPTLFALDAMLSIPNGFTYDPVSMAKESGAFELRRKNEGGGCGGGGDLASGSGGGGGCGGGCGGGGCGG